MTGAGEQSSGPLIWVVDDAVEDRELAMRAIRQVVPEARIETPLDLEAFHALLVGPRPDVVVTDYRIGWTNGLEVLASVKTKDASIPVIMFTNTGSEEICAEGMKAGLSDYIIKRRDQYPKVSHSVRAALEHAEMRRRLSTSQADLDRSRAELAELLQRERQARADSELARAEAVRASRIKDQFLATLSHELRTPLNAVLGWAHLLQMKKGDEAALAQGLEVIIRNTRMQAQLISDLLDMSRVVSGQMQLDLAEVDLGGVIAESVRSVQMSAEQKRIAIAPSLPDMPILVRGDVTRLQQVVWNLLTNAVKFTQEGGRVEVRVARDGQHARIEVVDNGEGIPADFMPHLFGMFRQADGSRTRRHGGLGIGLALVKELVQLHGGEVSAESTPGEGARFTVSLPLASSADVFAPRHGEPPPALPRDALQGIVVLSVDDDPDACALITSILELHGAKVHCARSAAEGYEKIQQLRPHVLVSDIGMPNEDGFSFMSRVRRLPAEAGGATPSVALTAFARAEDRERALASGFHAFAAKPVEPLELAAVVARLTDRLP